VIKMIFGVDNFNYGHVFNADEPIVIYKGYIINHAIENFDYKQGYKTPTTVSYDLITTVGETDFREEINQDMMPHTDYADTLAKQKETHKEKAMNYIDTITQDDVNGTESNENESNGTESNENESNGTESNENESNGTESNGNEIKGCIDESATNYNESATEDDGSCKYETNNDNLIYLGLGVLIIVLRIR